MSGLCKGDDFFKHMTGAALSFGVTGLFALYHGYLGLGLPSVWHKSVCVFYLLLMAIRGSIVQTEKDNKSRTEYQQNLYCQLRTAAGLERSTHAADCLDGGYGCACKYWAYTCNRHGCLYCLQDHDGFCTFL